MPLPSWPQRGGRSRLGPDDDPRRPDDPPPGGPDAEPRSQRALGRVEVEALFVIGAELRLDERVPPPSTQAAIRSAAAGATTSGHGIMSNPNPSKPSMCPESTT